MILLKKSESLCKFKKLFKIFLNNWYIFFENEHFENFFFKIIEIRL